jgi:hypothetical protein
MQPRRSILLGAIIAAAMTVGVGSSLANPAEVDATSCIRIVGGVFDVPGNDNYMPYLDNEYVTIRNYCASSRLMTGWKVHDYGWKHVYYFPAGFRIYPGYYVRLHSGLGTNTKYNLYWQRSYGAVWNNTPPERAYLLNQYGTTLSSWSRY